MPPRPCVHCGNLTNRASHCTSCAHHERAQYRRGWTGRSRRARARHLATHGSVCPGYGRPPHRVNPATLQLDHTTGQVLCHLCNVRAGPALRQKK
jgi:hypothetical protein